MLSESIDAISSRLDDVQTTFALTDRAVAAGIQLFVRTGNFPDHIADDEAIRQPLLDAAGLLFLSAPSFKPRYLLISSMHLGLVISGEREFKLILDELRSLDDDVDQLQDEPKWLTEYRDLGGDLPGAEEDPDELVLRFDNARDILREYHDEVLEFSRRVVDELATDFDRDVEGGHLSPLGADVADDIDDPDEAMKRAAEKLAEGDLLGARILYSAVLNEQPDNLDALVQRGILRASFEELSDAIDDFDGALELDPDHLVARLNRALALHSTGRVDEAISDYDRAIEQVDDNPEIWVNRGIARFSSQDFSAAKADLDRAIELDDSMVQAYFQRGNVHRVLGEVGHALRDYEKAIELAPGFVEAYSARGYLHLQLEDAQAAIADFQRAIELQPSDPALYYNRAHAHLLADDAQAAIADYDRALELDPEDVEALSNRGAARMMNGDLDGAVDDWETAIAIDPYYPTPYLKRASMWIATEQPEEAARDLQIALDNAPNDWPLRHDVEAMLEDLRTELGFDQPH